MKTCSKCKENIDLSNFCNNKAQKDGLNSECRQCSQDRKNNFYKTKEGVAERIYNSQKLKSKRRGHIPPEYTKSELMTWLFKEPTFHILYDEWVASGYEKKLKPSIDRKNDYIHYRFNNIQVMTWDQNSKKNYADRKSGKNNKKNKAVLQYTRKNVFIKEYHSGREAERQTGATHIPEALNGKYTHSGGFIWKHKEQ